MTSSGKITSKKLITAAQCRAARGLLGWSQDLLAEAANVSRSTVGNFEAGRSLAINNHKALHLAIVDAGIELIDPNGGGMGVRFRDRDGGNAAQSDEQG